MSEDKFVASFLSLLRLTLIIFTEFKNQISMLRINDDQSRKQYSVAYVRKRVVFFLCAVLASITFA